MKRIITFILIAMMLLTTVYADNVTQLGKTIEEERDSSYNITSINYRFITRANNTTYVVYTKYNEIGDQYFYLATLDGDKLNTIGEIDEMIGGNNEPTSYDVVGMPQYETDYYYVMGMVQIDGKVYIAKKRHIYRLDGDKLTELNLTFNGKPWSIEKLTKTTVIGKMVANDKALFITMSAVGTYLTADSENAFKTPLDGLVLRVDPDSEELTLTYTYLPHHFMLSENSNAFMHADFAVNSDEDRVVYACKIQENEMLKTVALGETLPDLMLTGIVQRYDDNFFKVMYVGNDIYSFKVNYTQYIKDMSIDIVKVTIDSRTPYRDKRRFAAAWKCTSYKIATIKNVSYVDSWSLGEDGNIYMVVNGGSQLYKVKL